MRIFVTGATGYIGGRLVPRLLEAGHQVVCAVRDARKLASRPWVSHDKITVMQVDAEDPDRLSDAMRGCELAYYLIHSMLAVGDAYRDHDNKLAAGFARAAAQAGVQRIVYLGGLGETGNGLSEHLSSRREVERALRSSDVPVTVLRAAMIIGSGSASFEILRYLVARLPVMVTPRWVSTECQPIAVRNVLHYLVACLDIAETSGRTLDIGGPDVLTYRELMQRMAEALGLRKRLVIPVPVLTPRLSSEGLRNRVVCRNDEASRLMPQRLLGVRESIDAALGRHSADTLESSWSDAGVVPGDPSWAGGDAYEDQRSIEIDASPETVFKVLCQLGGENGYYGSPLLWRVRGGMVRLVGGPGLSRGRRSQAKIAYGDAMDVWRVTRVETNRALGLRAEMKLPGIARLDFEIGEPAEGHGPVTLTQTATFLPRGILGHLYWLAVTPLHRPVFNGMLRGIKAHCVHPERRVGVASS